MTTIRVPLILSFAALVVGCATVKQVDENEQTPYTAEQKVQFDMAISAMRNNLPDDALTILLELADAAPALSGPLTNIGIIYLDKQEFALARQYLERAVAVNPENAAAHQYLGLTYRELGEFEPAETSYKQAIALDDAYAVAHRNLGILYDLYLNKLTKAKIHYEKYQSLTNEKDESVAIWLSDINQRIESGVE